MYRISVTLILVGLLAGCNCEVPLSITPIQQDDKKLACKDIILEINESEHYLQQAQFSRRITAGEILVPSCWVSGYMDSTQAVRSANARIDYLGKIYDLLDCDGSAKNRLSAPVLPVRKVPGGNPLVSGSSSPTAYVPQLPNTVSKRTNYPKQKDPNQNVKQWTHRHISSGGRVYEHSHPNQGAHSHEYSKEVEKPEAKESAE